MAKISTFFRPISYLLHFCFFIFLLSTSLSFGTCTCTAPVGCPEQTIAPCTTPSADEYILRYTITGVHGAMTFIGNTLGLSKETCQNEPGMSDAAGAFTTTDPSHAVGSFPSLSLGLGSPAGTTLTWQNNSSSAVLTLPAGIMVLYAELIWSGSYGYYCSTPTTGPVIAVDPNCILSFAGGPIFLTTPDNIVHPVMADPATALISQNPAPDVQPFYCAGNYTRSANITSLFLASSLANPNGTYTVSGVPATISGFDDTHNAAGWTLAIVYMDSTNMNINNMSLFVGAQQASRSNVVQPAAVTGFCAAPSLTMGQSARLLVSAVEGDANKDGDQMEFGPTPTTLTSLFGPNNLMDNFFASQINDDAGNLINMTGTFCGLNADPSSMQLVDGGRQGYDITNVDCSSTITVNQTTAFALGTTSNDDYTINAIGIQINVIAPVIVPIKRVNGQFSIVSEIGATVTFTNLIENTGSGGASDVVFKDVLETGLLIVPNTFFVNNVLIPGVTNASLAAGIPLGIINEMDTVMISFQVMIVGPPANGIVFDNSTTASFEFFACSQTQPFTGTNNSNIVMITLPNLTMPAPTMFNGKVKKCKFLDKTTHNLKATWVPVSIPTVLSYQIFKDWKLVQTIPASGPFVFETCLHSKSEASEFKIVAVYPNNLTSPPLNIRIQHE